MCTEAIKTFSHPYEYIFSRISLYNNIKHFQIQLYVVLTKGISMIFTHQLPFHGFKKMHTMLASIFQTSYHLKSIGE